MSKGIADLPHAPRIAPHFADEDNDATPAPVDEDADNANEDGLEDLTHEEALEARSLRSQARHKSRRADAGSDRVLDRLLAESDGLADLITTYQPARHERGWLLSSLRDFYEQGLIADVQASVKGGKEASVYRCLTGQDARKTVGSELVAVKVYRPRAFRNLRNDAQYREGRAVLTSEGTVVKNSDTRVMKAMGKKSEYGMQVRHTSWLMYEYTTLEALHRAGASVPRPFAASENAILMEYIGDETRAAPSLIETTLRQDEAEACFREVRRNLALLLAKGWIHGDLSAYNILYHDGKPTLIDFPQVIQRETNPDAEEIFYRDVERVCEYFRHQGMKVNAERLASDLWNKA